MTQRPVGAVLSNARSERVRAVRALAGRSVRSRVGRFLVEGPQAAREAVRLATVFELFITDGAADRYPEIVATAHQREIPVRLATDEVVAAMSADAQGVLAVVASTSLDTTLEQFLSASRPRLVAVMAQVRDPGNAGAVIRAADAAGADAVVITAGSVDVQNPKVVRATAGSLFHLPVISGVALADAVASLAGAGLTVLAASGAGDHDLDDLLDAAAGHGPAPIDLRASTAWVFGNEAWGLPQSDLELATATVRVPIWGAAESLNLATAATVCLYASARCHRST